MIKKYRVLGAMLASEEFTIESLAKLANVSPDTTRGIVDREKGYREKVGERESGRRGRKAHVYRVRDDRLLFL